MKKELPPIPERILLSKKEGSQLLGISVKMLDRYVAAGELKAIRLGSRVLFRREELDRFAQADHPSVSSRCSPKDRALAARGNVKTFRIP